MAATDDHTDHPTVRAVGRGAEAAGEGTPTPRPAALDALDVLVGRWINEGVTVEADGVDGMRIVTSDVYEWAPGRFHIVHSAYGQVAGNDVGGTEIINYDAESHCFRTVFFDSLGNTTMHHLIVDGDTWVWRGESTRCTARFSDGGRVQTASHERSDNHGATWQPSMRVTLTKIG